MHTTHHCVYTGRACTCCTWVCIHTAAPEQSARNSKSGTCCQGLLPETSHRRMPGRLHSSNALSPCNPREQPQHLPALCGRLLYHVTNSCRARGWAAQALKQYEQSKQSTSERLQTRMNATKLVDLTNEACCTAQPPPTLTTAHTSIRD